MSEIRDAARTMLQRLQWKYLTDEEHDAFALPWFVGDDLRLLISIRANEDSRDAIVETGVCLVPARRAAAVALVLAKLNARFRFVTFSLEDGQVRADVCVQVLGGEHADAQLALAVIHLVRALEETHRDILSAARRRTRAETRVERDITTVLDDLNF